MKNFVAGGTGAIGRPLIAELLAEGHTLVALTRDSEKTQALVERWKHARVDDERAVRRPPSSLRESCGPSTKFATGTMMSRV
jgi:nucleoside-diphosphate-sugar epimerase